MIRINKSRILYYYIKFAREKGTPDYIARGWSLGVLIGLAIPFGFQLFIVIPLSFLLKASRIGAVAGTFITNNFTIIVIYPFQVWLGSCIFGNPISYAAVKSDLQQFVAEPSFKALATMGGEIVASFFMGGFLLAVIAAPITYFGVRALVIRHRNRAEVRRWKRLDALLKEAEASVDENIKEGKIGK